MPSIYGPIFGIETSLSPFFFGGLPSPLSEVAPLGDPIPFANPFDTGLNLGGFGGWGRLSFVGSFGGPPLSEKGNILYAGEVVRKIGEDFRDTNPWYFPWVWERMVNGLRYFSNMTDMIRDWNPSFFGENPQGSQAPPGPSAPPPSNNVSLGGGQPPPPHHGGGAKEPPPAEAKKETSSEEEKTKTKEEMKKEIEAKLTSFQYKKENTLSEDQVPDDIRKKENAGANGLVFKIEPLTYYIWVKGSDVYMGMPIGEGAVAKQIIGSFKKGWKFVLHSNFPWKDVLASFGY